jgi:hypothetical protein
MDVWQKKQTVGVVRRRNGPMLFLSTRPQMSLAPTPSAARGDLILQSPFFTSSLFVDPFRADIERLVDIFVQEYADHATKPFALFKRIWQDQGWTYMHLKTFDARTRHTYLTVACRLFIGLYFLYCMNVLINTGGR